jgi:hypothetical protein
MAVMAGEQRRVVIREALIRLTGNATDVHAIADATVINWHQMAARLAPMIGARGVDTLFDRALHLTSRTFPWLAVVGADRDSQTLLASLKTHLTSQEPAVGAAAAAALLVTFTELLASLVGDSLTERLLGPVWTPALPESQQELGS